MSKGRIGKSKAVPEKSADTVAMNKSDTNDDTCCMGTNFIPLVYTNKSANVYPYNGAYDPIENVPIVSWATAYNHPKGTTYIIVFNESLYYGTKMQHSLINPNQAHFHGLDLFDNHVRDDKLCIRVDKKTVIHLKFKGTKCVFESRVPTRCELGSCTHYDMTSDAQWNPWAIDLWSLRKIYQVKKGSRTVYNVKHNT